MTNKEYIEKNDMSFSDVMKMWDEKNYPCINDWLKANRIECPFKAGDFLKYRFNDDAIYVVIDIKDVVYYRAINRDGTFSKWSFSVSPECKYHTEDNTVYACQIDECANLFEKIY